MICKMKQESGFFIGFCQTKITSDCDLQCYKMYQLSNIITHSIDKHHCGRESNFASVLFVIHTVLISTNQNIKKARRKHL